ncbi:hypothetical protein NDU88_005495 [Pleurodeles waltl]|uniref:Uncharacterized protein n=1 Tax=Pleurodeles waltl TaxID=8319 RepID=A0AAV7LLB5_PLEWA|nr:hypothetical protein NDU88_005495 [Pleurodeles waltl]
MNRLILIWKNLYTVQLTVLVLQNQERNKTYRNMTAEGSALGEPAPINRADRNGAAWRHGSSSGCRESWSSGEAAAADPVKRASRGLAPKDRARGADAAAPAPRTLGTPPNFLRRGEPPERTWGPREALADQRLGGTYVTGPSPKLDAGARHCPTERAPGRGGDTGGSWDRAGDPLARHTQRISPPPTGRSSGRSLTSAGGPAGAEWVQLPTSPLSLRLSMGPAVGETCPPRLLLTIQGLKIHTEGAKGAVALDHGVPIGGWSSGRVASAWPARRTQVAT